MANAVKTSTDTLLPAAETKSRKRASTEAAETFDFALKRARPKPAPKPAADPKPTAKRQARADKPKQAPEPRQEEQVQRSADEQAATKPSEVENDQPVTEEPVAEELQEKPAKPAKVESDEHDTQPIEALQTTLEQPVIARIDPDAEQHQQAKDGKQGVAKQVLQQVGEPQTPAQALERAGVKPLKPVDPSKAPNTGILRPDATEAIEQPVGDDVAIATEIVDDIVIPEFESAGEEEGADAEVADPDSRPVAKLPKAASAAPIVDGIAIGEAPAETGGPEVRVVKPEAVEVESISAEQVAQISGQAEESEPQARAAAVEHTKATPEIGGDVQPKTHAPEALARPVPPPPSSPPPPPESRFAEANHAQIVTGIRGQLLPEGGTMHIRLDPPELGALQVSIHMQDGVMTASFQTSNDEATKLLSHSLAQLKHVLESQGVSVDKLHVSQAPRDQQAGNDDNRQQQNGSDNPSARQEQQRREIVQRLWRRMRDGSDPLDMVA